MVISGGWQLLVKMIKYYDFCLLLFKLKLMRGKNIKAKLQKIAQDENCYSENDNSSQMCTNMHKHFVK